MSIEREQFTCFRSFYDAIRKIRKSADRAKAYDILMEYAFFGTEPEVDKLPAAVAITFLLAKPNLDASRRKAESGKRGGTAKQTPSSEEANAKQTESKSEANGKQGETASKKENKKEGEKEKENEKESYNPQTPFGRFWDAYPKKVGKLDAEKAFKKVKVPPDRLLSAIEAQKQSAQWRKEGGQFIPNPATWLNQGRWDDCLEVEQAQPAQLGSLELDAIQRIMRSEEE